MSNPAREQARRIKTIIRFPKVARKEFALIASRNLEDLEPELEKYWAITKLYKDRLSVVHWPGIDESYGALAVRVSNLFDLRAIWKKGVDKGGYINKHLRFYGEAGDLTLGNYIMAYCTTVLDNHYEAHKAYKISFNRKQRSMEGLKKTTEHSRTYASNKRAKALSDMCSALDTLLESKGKNHKKEAIESFIREREKLDFKIPGPHKEIPREEIPFKYAMTEPTKFKINRLIN